MNEESHVRVHRSIARFYFYTLIVLALWSGVATGLWYSANHKHDKALFIVIDDVDSSKMNVCVTYPLDSGKVCESNYIMPKNDSTYKILDNSLKDIMK